MLIKKSVANILDYIKRHKIEFIFFFVLLLLFFVSEIFVFLPNNIIKTLLNIPLFVVYLTIAPIYCSFPPFIEKVLMKSCDDLGKTTFVGVF